MVRDSMCAIFWAKDMAGAPRRLPNVMELLDLWSSMKLLLYHVHKRANREANYPVKHGVSIDALWVWFNFLPKKKKRFGLTKATRRG